MCVCLCVLCICLCLQALDLLQNNKSNKSSRWKKCNNEGFHLRTSVFQSPPSRPNTRSLPSFLPVCTDPSKSLQSASRYSQRKTRKEADKYHLTHRPVCGMNSLWCDSSSQSYCCVCTTAYIIYNYSREYDTRLMVLTCILISCCVPKSQQE